jgi:alkylhydroperoxidase family enzyme
MRLMTVGFLCVWSIAVLAALPEGTAAQATSMHLLVPPPPGNSRPVHPASPRIPPLTDAQLTDMHRRVLAKYRAGEQPGNALRTLATVPELVDGTMPFQEYIANRSSLSPRHRELLILRTAWLLNNDHIWGEHAAAAQAAGLTAGEIHRVAEGPSVRSWDPFEAALLRLADELFRNSSVTDATWKALEAQYDMFHLLDAVMTVTDFTTTGLLYNAFGVQPDRDRTARIPSDVPYRVSVPPREPALRVARVRPLPGSGLAIARTFANYPALAEPRGSGANYVNQVSKLDPRFREILILRTGWDAQAEYEWAQHVGSVGRAREKGLDPLMIAQGPDAKGWSPFERTLLNAADELFTDSTISDRTWRALAERFDTPMLMNATITAANYRMVSMALNALGVQIDPGDEHFPGAPASRR